MPSNLGFKANISHFNNIVKYTEQKDTSAFKSKHQNPVINNTQMM